MIEKKDIEDLKRKLEVSIGKTITLRYDYDKTKGSKRGQVCSYIIESVCRDLFVLRKEIKENIGLIECYTFKDILSGFIEIIDIK